MNCQYHQDRESTHIVEFTKVPLCEECAEAESANGLLVLTFVFELPVIVKEDDDWPDTVEI